MRSTASPGCVSSQIVLEAILKEHAERARHATILFHHEKVAIEPDADAVRTTVLDRGTGERLTVASAYVVVCEGCAAAPARRSGARSSDRRPSAT